MVVSTVDPHHLPENILIEGLILHLKKSDEFIRQNIHAIAVELGDAEV